jgi:uncharacterized protein (TIGR03067 family)
MYMKPVGYGLVLLVAMSASGAALNGAQPNNPAKSLDGTWQCTSIVAHTGPFQDDVVKKVSIKIVGARATLIVADKTVMIRIRTNFAKKVAEIDLTVEDGALKGKTYPGLFVLEKNELKVRVADSGFERPIALQFGKDYTMLVVFKRIE